MSECGKCDDLPLARKCRDCLNAYHREWRRKNPERSRAMDRKSNERYRNSPRGKAKRREYQRSNRHGYNLRVKYGLDPETYALMLEAQAHCCPICGREFSDSMLPCVDHDHETGEVRSLLCRTCNAALGSFRDDVRMLRVALEYLEAHERTRK